MKRLVVALAVGLVLISGCTAPAPPAPAPTAPVDSREPTATLVVTHGGEFVSARLDPGTSEEASLTVTLKSSEPSGTLPFADLVLIESLDPGKARYWVNYDSPDGQVRYTWSPQGRQVQIWRPGLQPMRKPTAYTPDAVDIDMLKAVAAGQKPRPAFAVPR